MGEPDLALHEFLRIAEHFVRRPPSISGRPLALQKAAMACRITVVRDTDRCLVYLAGNLTVAQVPELLDVCAGGRGLEFNLADLMAADTAGIEALQHLRDRGATLVGAAGYIQLKLDTPT